MRRPGIALEALAVVACACLSMPSCAPLVEGEPASAASVAQARVIVTTDFGAGVVLDAVVGLSPGMTAMEALSQVADVDTGYGGGFVEGINGIGTGVSGKSARRDWFYSINGFTARTGAAGYELHDGDTEHWDYRNWSHHSNVSATLGAFPLAFSKGYGGVVRDSVVAYEPEFADEANDLLRVLEDAGAQRVDSIPLADVADEMLETDNVVVLAACTADLVREVNTKADRLGLFARFDGAALHTYAGDGVQTGVHSHAGVILAMQNPWNPRGTGACQSVAVVVTGCDEVSVRAAAGVLARDYNELVCCTGAVVQEEAWGRVP
jgi:hypothetical protein